MKKIFNQRLSQNSSSISSSLFFVRTRLDVESSYNDDCSRFQFKKLNFFDFKYNKKTIFEAISLKNIIEKIVYRDVYLFIERAKNFAKTHDDNIIRINLYRCLKNIAII